MRIALIVALTALCPRWGQAQSCDPYFLRDFTINYAKLYCSDTKGGAACFAQVAEMISGYGSYVAWTGLAAVPLAGAAKAAVDTGKITRTALVEFIKGYGPRAAVAGGTTFATGLVVAGVGKFAGALADPIISGSQSSLNEACPIDHPQYAAAMIYAERRSRCVPLIQVRKNPMVAQFFNLPSEAARIEVLKQPGSCDYYQKIANMVDHKLNQRKIALYKGPRPAAAPEVQLTDDPGAAAR